jgi:diguanylate cyclase (GGDEF)-like protein
MRWLRWWVCIFALLPVTASAAGDARWPSMADPVVRPVVQSDDQATLVLPLVMSQGGAGFLWAGGQAGLLRWDGYRFAVYADGRNPPDGLRNHYVQALYPAGDGGVWVGTSSELARYDPQHDRFTTIPLGGSGALSVSGLDGDGAGGLYAATSAGLFRLDANRHVIAHLRHDAHTPGSLPDDQIEAILRDRQGALWVGGRHGLAHSLDGGTFTDVKLPAPGDAVPEVSRLLQDSAGRIWIGTREHGAYVIGPDGAATPIALPDSDGTDLTGTEIMAIAEVGGTGVGGAGVGGAGVGGAEVTGGKIWLGTFGHGIIEVDAATMQARRIRHDPLVPGSLDSDSVYAIFRDRSGLIWIGTTLGVSQYNPGDGGIWTLFGEPNRHAGVVGHDITAVLVRPDGTVWLGSQADGIQIIGPSGHTRATLDVRRVFCLAAEGSGPVFIGTRSGLYRADPDGGHLTRMEIPGRRAIAGVFALHAEAGTLWLGGGDDGLWALRPGADGRLTVLRHDDVPRLTDSMVHRIVRGPGNLLAIGTENGFNILDTGTGAIERVQNDPADPRSVGPGGVVSFLFDRQGRLWVGSGNAGISVLTGRDSAGRPRFHRLGVADGLPNPDVSNLLMDAQGRVWASTDSGLAVIDTETFAVRAFRAIDGVAIPAYWNASADATSQGDLLFGGTGGLTVVRPGAVGAWDFAPPLVVTSVRVGGKPAGPLDGGEITVPAGAGSVAVEFASLDFSAPARLRYRYRLDDFDAAWIETDAAHRVAAYTNLPPGQYVLALQGSNRDGVWAVPATLPILVRPAWFQTGWFRLIEAAAAALLVGVLVQTRTVILRQRQRELELQVHQRTAELSARTLELTQSQAKLQQLAYVDTLTALPNRRAFHDTLQIMIDDARLEPFALMLVDLDGFKKVNDTLGHDAGDELLTIAALRLREAVRGDDFVSRLGGDEFALLLRVRDREMVCMIGDRLVAGMAVPMQVKGATVTIGASAGAALYPQNGQTQEELYKHVDLALYAAKRAGRGAWRWYVESMETGNPPLGR